MTRNRTTERYFNRAARLAKAKGDGDLRCPYAPGDLCPHIPSPWWLELFDYEIKRRANLLAEGGYYAGSAGRR